MKPQPRIALFLPDLTGGGAERVTVNLAQGFSERGLKVDLVLIKATGPYLSQLPSEVRVIDLGTKRALLSPPALIRYMRKERPVALISALHHANIAALWAKRFSNSSTRIVVTIHNNLSLTNQHASGARTRLMPNFLRYCFPWADEIVAVSKGVADDFAVVTGLNRGRIKTIYNPVVSAMLIKRAKEAVNHPWFAPGQPPVILAVGRLTRQKDFPTLIRAFDVVQRTRPARLMILGEGEDRPSLEALVRQLDLNDSVCLPGFVNNPYAYLSRASVFVLSSIWEGLPTVLIEALAVGVPVVSTDCESGPREILDDGKYGRLVAVNDSIALSEAIEKTLDQTPTKINQDCFKRFTWEASIDAYLRVAGVTTHA